MLKPAKEGTGVIAGGSVRAILDLAGVRDVVSKSLGARTKLNMAEAAMNGLKSMKTIEEVAQLRGKKRRGDFRIMKLHELEKNIGAKHC